MTSSDPISQSAPEFPTVRVALAERRFQSPAIEAAIAEFKANVADVELGWLFENCFPNTLDTTVTFEVLDGRPSTYVITGDIDAMWLRDSTAQVWPYLKFLHDEPLRQLVAGLIRKQAECVIRDPYANAFYKGGQVGHWASDHTEMRAGIHERKWEIDSLCYPIRLAYHFWKITGDASAFDEPWLRSIELTLQTFREQQRKENPGPYTFQRATRHATDTLPLSGQGYPVKPVGLICSSFRPSDDATVFPFLVPSNFFAVQSLRQAAEIIGHVDPGSALIQELGALANEVEAALREHAIVSTQSSGACTPSR